MEFVLLISILLFALTPIIVPLVFSKIMAAKEGDKTNDFPRKFSKTLGWIFVVLVSLFLIYLALTLETGNPHFNQIFKIIISIFGVFKWTCTLSVVIVNDKTQDCGPQRSLKNVYGTVGSPE